MVTTDIYSNPANRQITEEEYKRLWYPFLNAQPSDDPAKQAFRDAVDAIMERVPLEAMSPGLIADYAKYKALYEGMEEELTAEGYDIYDLDKDLDNPKCEIYRLRCDIASDLYSLVNAESRLYEQKARAAEESE